MFVDCNIVGFGSLLNSRLRSSFHRQAFRLQRDNFADARIGIVHALASRQLPLLWHRLWCLYFLPPFCCRALVRYRKTISPPLIESHVRYDSCLFLVLQLDHRFVIDQYARKSMKASQLGTIPSMQDLSSCWVTQVKLWRLF